MKTKVFGIGLGKTGTSTLKIILERLGYKVHDGCIEIVKPAIDRDMEKIYPLVDEYDAFEDEPWSFLYKELDEHYPKSKFILTVRKSPETWVKSMINHSTNCGYRGRANCVYYHQMCFGLPYVINHEEEFEQKYYEHNAHIRGYFKARKNTDFLEVCFENGDGIEKICNFLGEPLPKDMNIPHEKKADYISYDRVIRLAKKEPNRFYPSFNEAREYLRL